MVNFDNNVKNMKSSNVTEEGFWNAIDIFLKKPHVVNKRVWGVKSIFNFIMYTKSSESISINEIKRLDNEDTIKDEATFLIYLMQQLPIEQNIQNTEVKVILTELLPKTYSDVHAYNLICIFKREMKVIFYDVTPKEYKQNLSPTFPYSLNFQNQKVNLNALCDTTINSYKWLVTTVLPQIIVWAGDNVSPKTGFHCESLSLVSSDKYYTKYNELKNKYGKEMVKIWPECTDPAKFVYEDIAIATYLILLWEEERSNLTLTKPQAFVDLGCGNGLLVYILTSEGYPGLGLDVRKRSIWDMYPENIKLEEKTITPSEFSLFPDADWIIGNHSDELTPWIPVLTLRSSYKCRYFLLPCCAYNFDGSKYQRKNSSKSQYTEYLEYIRSISMDCGFNTESDRLKIPSTKRLCLVGRQRIYPAEKHNIFCNKIKSIIKPSEASNVTDCSDWIPNLKLRKPVEKVQNCTQIDKSIIEYIVKCVTKYLIENCSKANIEWSIGKTVQINDLVKLIPTDKLKILKSECGGLQTLLKNNHHIFKVEGGQVNLRYPKSISEMKNNSIKNKSIVSINIKKKPCWFYDNHPQGCPLSDINCSYIHS